MAPCMGPDGDTVTVGVGTVYKKYIYVHDYMYNCFREI